MNNHLTKIKKNLYEIETILSTDTTVKLLAKCNIDSKKFLDTINLYMKHFNSLENIEDDLLIQMLDEKLDYFVKNSQNNTNITLYHEKLSTSITFVQDKANKLLNLNSLTDTKNDERLKTDITKSIDSISIKEFFSIKNLNLSNLSDKKEIYIVGENGDGKSLLLQAIAIGLKGVKEGDIFDMVKNQNNYQIALTLKDDTIFDNNISNFNNIFAYGSNRNNSCKMDIDKSGYLTLFNNSLDLNDPIKWLVELFNAEKSDDKKTISLDQAKNILKEILNRDISIEVTHKDVLFKEKGSPVEFDQLSAGYKSVIIIICDLIARLSETQKDIEDTNEFKGIVLIDEVELHLHPKWKYDFVSKLMEFFPNIQFIVTTHSPTVILGASKKAVFYKIYKENSEVCISNQIENKGYTNNTIISSPLFSLETMASRDFDNSTFSGDDFVYKKIHESISKKIATENIIDEDEIMKLIDEELKKL